MSEAADVLCEMCDRFSNVRNRLECLIDKYSGSSVEEITMIIVLLQQQRIVFFSEMIRLTLIYLLPIIQFHYKHSSYQESVSTCSSSFYSSSSCSTYSSDHLYHATRVLSAFHLSFMDCFTALWNTLPPPPPPSQPSLSLTSPPSIPPLSVPSDFLTHLSSLLFLSAKPTSANTTAKRALLAIASQCTATAATTTTPPSTYTSSTHSTHSSHSSDSNCTLAYQHNTGLASLCIPLLLPQLCEPPLGSCPLGNRPPPLLYAAAKDVAHYCRANYQQIGQSILLYTHTHMHAIVAVAGLEDMYAASVSIDVCKCMMECRRVFCEASDRLCKPLLLDTSLHRCLHSLKHTTRRLFWLLVMCGMYPSSYGEDSDMCSEGSPKHFVSYREDMRDALRAILPRSQDSVKYSLYTIEEFIADFVSIIRFLGNPNGTALPDHLPLHLVTQQMDWRFAEALLHALTAVSKSLPVDSRSSELSVVWDVILQPALLPCERGLLCTLTMAIAVTVPWTANHPSYIDKMYEVVSRCLRMPQDEGPYSMSAKQDHVAAYALMKLAPLLGAYVGQMSSDYGEIVMSNNLLNPNVPFADPTLGMRQQGLLLLVAALGRVFVYDRGALIRGEDGCGYVEAFIRLHLAWLGHLSTSRERCCYVMSAIEVLLAVTFVTESSSCCSAVTRQLGVEQHCYGGEVRLDMMEAMGEVLQQNWSVIAACAQHNSTCSAVSSGMCSLWTALLTIPVSSELESHQRTVTLVASELLNLLATEPRLSCCIVVLSEAVKRVTARESSFANTMEPAVIRSIEITSSAVSRDYNVFQTLDELCRLGSECASTMPWVAASLACQFMKAAVLVLGGGHGEPLRELPRGCVQLLKTRHRDNEARTSWSAALLKPYDGPSKMIGGWDKLPVGSVLLRLLFNALHDFTLPSNSLGDVVDCVWNLQAQYGDSFMVILKAAVINESHFVVLFTECTKGNKQRFKQALKTYCGGKRKGETDKSINRNG
eukprot:GHVQ01021739.1.p1 GENE.GHVQ01021739.1~~GHVQ01021739.1.p1  ORF type:complete len:1152 (-),score=231.99 GHVQ01021739.1:1958-4927(-)